MRVPKPQLLVGAALVGIFSTAILTGSSFGETASTSTTSTSTSTTSTSTTSTSTTSTSLPPTTTARDSQDDTLAKILITLNARYAWGERSERVRSLQTVLGVDTDGLYGKQTRVAHLGALTFYGQPTSNVPAVPVTLSQPQKPNSVKTTVPATPTTTRPAGNACPQWESLATSIGWPAAQIPKLSRIMYRESNCQPGAWNRRDPGTGSRGLTQINSFWCSKNKYNPTGWLQARGVLSTCEDLFDPATSLRATLAIWQYAGWQPWGG